MDATLELRGISKRFGSLSALSKVDFVLTRGEVHALLGENGAGKSTLMRIAFGLLQPEAGAILVDGTRVTVSTPVVARRLGMGMVHQHFTSIGAFSVAENIALAAGWRVRSRTLANQVRDLMARTGLSLDPAALAGSLPATLKQRLEVLKALASDARILLLDEPSSVLPPTDSEALLGMVRELRDRGVSSVLITHKLGEALRVSDRITVLRQGMVVFTGSTNGQTSTTLARLMIGEGDWIRVTGERVSSSGPVSVLADKLGVQRDGPSGYELSEATFAVRAGEVVGVAAVDGNGERELLRAVAGLLRPAGGQLVVAAPVSFIAEDRSSESLIGDFTLAENVALMLGREGDWVRGPWLDWRRVRSRTAELIARYEVRAPGPLALAESLSGGNQQRMVVAAALDRRPAVVVAENPTRGLDLKAAGEVQARLRDAASAGAAVLFHSSDLDEVMELADRVIVVANGVAAQLAPGATRTEIGERMVAGVNRELRGADRGR
jgi:simple sugar transport system ATP-binding protein